MESPFICEKKHKVLKRSLMIILTDEISEYQLLLQPFCFYFKHVFSFIVNVQLVLLPKYRNVIRFQLCHSTCVITNLTRLVTLPELKCNLFYTTAREAINNLRFTITRNELQSLKNCFNTFGTLTSSYNSRYRM